MEMGDHQLSQDGLKASGVVGTGATFPATAGGAALSSVKDRGQVLGADHIAAGAVVRWSVSASNGVR